MNDEKMELMIGHLLRIGVILAALVVATGGLIYLHQSHGPRPNYASFHSVSPDLRSPSGILRKLPSGNSGAIIQLGLLLLIATPIARVIFAAAGFSLERDWFYTAVSLLVLAVLMYSLFYGH